LKIEIKAYLDDGEKVVDLDVTEEMLDLILPHKDRQIPGLTMVDHKNVTKFCQRYVEPAIASLGWSIHED